MKRLLGEWLAYRVGLLRALWSYRPPAMRVTCDSQPREERFLLACASNSERAGGGIRLAPGAQLDDGLLNINLVEAVNRREALRQFVRLCQGRHTAHPKVSYLTALSLAVEAEPALEVVADGDLIGHTPARFNVKPKALQVRVPRDR
jgi:diacylglycerol kinase (ATP)